MKWILYFSFFLPLYVYSFTEKDLHISTHQFNRYVKPQLTSIVQDYYTLLGVLNPETKHLKPFVISFKSLKESMDSLSRICNISTEKISCNETLQITINKINQGNYLLSQRIKFVEKKDFTADDLLLSFKQKFQLETHLKNLIYKLQKQQFYLSLKMPLPSLFIELKNDLELCENLLNDYLIKSSDRRFRKPFLSFWNDFIKPVNNLILPHNDFSLYIRKLNELNLRLNFFNVALTKRNQAINKQAHLLLNIIHNRWKSILKVSLRR